jgi:hsp70-interacting protein
MSSSGTGGPNWLGLLKWSLAHTDGTAPSQATAMSEEDKKWLEQVMKECVKDEPARMNEIMLEITSKLDTRTCGQDEAKLEDDLDELRDIVEHIDMARIFVKFGGLQCLLGLLKTDEPIGEEIRCLAAGIIGTLSQNNIIVQEEIYASGIVDNLCDMCIHNTSDKLCAKVIASIH